MSLATSAATLVPTDVFISPDPDWGGIAYYVFPSGDVGYGDGLSGVYGSYGIW